VNAGTTAYSVDVRITAPVHGTEVTARVVDAVEALSPGAEVEERDGRIVAETHSLEHLSERLHRQEILDTARSAFFEGLAGDTFAFQLKKQAAFAGVVNFAVGPPDELGEIEVEVEVREPDVEAFIDYVAPPTDGGVPVDVDVADGDGATGADG
jgi:predicted RNA binding protein with dsRBD fold (UPF0201 family)